MLAVGGGILPAARSLRSLTTNPENARAPNANVPSVRPGTHHARPGAGDGGRGEREGDGTAQAPASACVVSTSYVARPIRPSTSRVTGSLRPEKRDKVAWHAGCERLRA